MSADSRRFSSASSISCTRPVAASCCLSRSRRRCISAPSSSCCLRSSARLRNSSTTRPSSGGVSAALLLPRKPNGFSAFIDPCAARGRDLRCETRGRDRCSTPATYLTSYSGPNADPVHAPPPRAGAAGASWSCCDRPFLGFDQPGVVIDAHAHVRVGGDYRRPRVEKIGEIEAGGVGRALASR